MTLERWRRIEQIYSAALGHDRARRPAFLIDACAEDEELRRQVESLFEHRSADDVLPRSLGWDTPQRVEPPSPGTRLGPYEIAGHVGSGGMGHVYRACDTRLGRTVAIKVMRPELAGDIEFHERLQREARAISALNHPHVCTLFDIGEDRGIGYLVMEFVAGEPLSEVLRNGPLAVRKVAEYGIQVAGALTAAHAQGIVHRDLKPSNLMVTPGGIKVLDFGLARFAPADAALSAVQTATAAVMGTPAYMSPEQTRREPGDARSDIFSLGCVLYEAATGRTPFQGPSVLSILHEIATATPAPASSIRPDLPPMVDTILARALEKAPEHRYASAADLGQALQALLSPAMSLPAIGSAAPPGGSARVVGRAEETAKFEAILGRAAAGAGNLVLITGEAGIGKTALAEAFVEIVRRRHPEALVGRGFCVEHYGVGEAYLPFLESTASLLHGPGAAPVKGTLRRYAPTWCLQFPAVFGAAGLEVLRGETIGATGERMLREWGDAIGALASMALVVVVLEDLHWADTPSIDLVRRIGPLAGGKRLLVVATSRPEETDPRNPLKGCRRELQAHGQCEEIPLVGLSRDHIASYLDWRFSPNRFPTEFAESIYRKTEGHPLFATRAIDFLLERREIVRRNNEWALSRPLAEIRLEVPESVRGLILKQLEALDEDELRILQCASIEGEEFTSIVVAALNGADELRVEEQLDRLSRVHRLIREEGEDELPDGSVATRRRFTHALYRTTLYESLPPRRRELLHRQAGETLARSYQNETERIAGALAMHFERGRVFPRAIEYLIKAAEVAAGRYANEAAEEHYSNALRLVDRLPDGERLRVAVPVRYKRGSARMALRKFRAAEEDFEGMLSLGRELNDPALQCRALILLADKHFYAHEIDEIGARAQAAIRLAEEAREPGLVAEANAHLSRMPLVLGRIDEAKAIAGRGIMLARSVSDRRALAAGLLSRGSAHCFQSEYREAAELLEETVNVASGLRDGVTLPLALMFLGLARGNAGDISGSLASLRQWQAISQRNSSEPALMRIPNCLGWIYGEMQDFDRAIEHDSEGVRLARKGGMVEAEANSLINLLQAYTQTSQFENGAAILGEVEALHGRDRWNQWRFFGIRYHVAAAEYWHAWGDPARAAVHAREAIRNSAAHSAAKHEAAARTILADIAASAGEHETAKSELLAAADALRLRPAPLVGWKVYAALGRLCRQTGNTSESLAAFSHAASIVSAIAATVDDPALKRSFLNAPAAIETAERTAGIA